MYEPDVICGKDDRQLTKQFFLSNQQSFFSLGSAFWPTKFTLTAKMDYLKSWQLSFMPEEPAVHVMLLDYAFLSSTTA